MTTRFRPWTDAPIAAILESEVAELAGNVTHRELLDQAAEACRAGIPAYTCWTGKCAACWWRNFSPKKA